MSIRILKITPPISAESIGSSDEHSLFLLIYSVGNALPIWSYALSNEGVADSSGSVRTTFLVLLQTLAYLPHWHPFAESSITVNTERHSE